MTDWALPRNPPAMKLPLGSYRARLIAAFALLLALAPSVSAVIERHQLPPIAPFAASSTYALTVDGLNVQVTSFGGGYDYAHFTRVSGAMNMRSTVQSASGPSARRSCPFPP